MTEESLDNRILMLLSRLKIIKEKLEELIEIGDTTIEHSALSQLNDFEASIYELQYIVDKVDNSYNIDKEYALEIVINAGKFCGDVRRQKTIQNDATSTVQSIMRACKDDVDKMIQILKNRENWLLDQLESYRNENEELKRRIKELTGNEKEGMNTKEIAENIIRNRFKNVSSKKKNSLEAIITFFIENKNEDLTYRDISKRVNLSKPTIYRICKDLVKEGVLREIAGSKHTTWTYVL